MCIGIFSFRAFDRRLARLAAPISSGVRQGGQNLPPPSGARSAEYPSGARVKWRWSRQSADYLGLFGLFTAFSPWIQSTACRVLKHGVPYLECRGFETTAFGKIAYCRTYGEIVSTALVRWGPGDILHQKQFFVFKIKHFKIWNFWHDLDLTL